MVARSVIDVILGEAVGDSRSRSVSREERFQDMLAIASAISNRSVTSGVPAKDIVSVQREFNAYGKSLPSGVEKHRDLAEKAWNQVQTQGPVHNGTFYAAPNAVEGLPEGLTQVATTAGHQFFSDPQGRAFNTAIGYVTPDMSALSTGTRATSSPTPGMGASRFDFGGYGGLVAPSVVGLTDISLPDMAPVPDARPAGPGMAALAPNGLAETSSTRGTPISSYDRAGLHSSLGPLMDAFTANPTLAGLGINSGYRSPSRNAAAGGASRSQHMGGRALDIDIRNLTDDEKELALDTALERGGARGIGIYPGERTMHADTRPMPAAWGQVPGREYAAIHNYDGKPGLSEEDLGLMPAFAQDSIRDLYDAQGFAVTPRGLVSDIPTPTSRPDPATAAMAGLGTGRPEGPLGGFPAAPDIALAPEAMAPATVPDYVPEWSPAATPSTPAPSLAGLGGGRPAGPLGGLPAAPTSPVDTFANLPEFAPVPEAAQRSSGLLAPPVGPVPSLAPPVASVPGASINPMKGSEPGRHNKAGFGDFAKGAVKGGMAAGLPGAVAGGVIGGLRGSRVENPGPGKTGPLGLGLLGTNRGGPLGLGILPGLASLFGGGSGGLGGLGGLFDFSGGGWASSPGYGGTFSSPGDGGGFSTRGDSGWDAPGYR